MTTYYAVVKYAIDDDEKIKRRALTEGLGMICMQLVAEFGFTLDQIENALANAQGEAEMELDYKRMREEKEAEDGDERT